MKIAVVVSLDEKETIFRQFNVKPETDQELDEAIVDTMAFLKECYGEIDQEGF